MSIARIILLALSALMCLTGLIVLISSHLRYKEIYREYTDYLDKKEVSLKEYLHIGLGLNDSINILKFFPSILRPELNKYAVSVKSKINELYGNRYTDFYLEIHSAKKYLYALIVFTLCSVLALLLLLTNGDVSSAAVFLGIAIAGAIGIPFLVDYELNSRIEERRMQLQLEFPDFVNTLILLVNAGMTIPKAWEKIVSENTKDTPLYRELGMCRAEIEAGKSEAAAYEEFGRRCKIKEIIKFISIIILNLRKGGSEIVPALKAEADECWEMRKATARRLGEKASSKLMLPMAIMLVGIMLITVLPAILALSSM